MDSPKERKIPLHQKPEIYFVSFPCTLNNLVYIYIKKKKKKKKKNIYIYIYIYKNKVVNAQIKLNKVAKCIYNVQQ